MRSMSWGVFNCMSWGGGEEKYTREACPGVCSGGRESE